MALVRFGILIFSLGTLLGCQTTSNTTPVNATANATLPNEQQLIEMATIAYKANQNRNPHRLSIRSVKQERVYFTGKQWIVCLSTSEKAYHTIANEIGGVKAADTYDAISKTWAMDLNHTNRDGWYVGIFRKDGDMIGSKNVSDLCKTSQQE